MHPQCINGRRHNCSTEDDKEKRTFDDKIKKLKIEKDYRM